jgi:hypothetical protein
MPAGGTNWVALLLLGRGRIDSGDSLTAVEASTIQSRD